MAKVLEETADDLLEDALENEFTVEEERAAAAMGQYTEHSGEDLSDGGKVGEATIFPTRDGVKQEQGRPTARRCWMWDGTESTIPLAWNPDGTQHDGGRRFLRKRHCLCCNHSGVFPKNQCTECKFYNCNKCRSSSDPTKIIPCFYLRKDDVPFQAKFYGDIPCFLEFCPRKDSYGFQTMEDMRIHARSRHRLEYLAHTETMAANKADKQDELQAQVNMLLANALHGNQVVVPEEIPSDEPVLVGTSEAPLYVSDKPVKPKRKKRTTK